MFLQKMPESGLDQSLIATSTVKRMLVWVALSVLALAGTVGTQLHAQNPASPSNLTVHFTHYQGTNPQFVWFWADNSNNEAGFHIEYLNGSTWDLLETTGANVTAWTNVYGVIGQGAVITFRVRAFTGTSPSFAHSAASNSVSVQIPAKTWAKPANLTCVPQTESVIRVQWTDVSTTEDGVELWMDEGQGFEDLGDIFFYQAQSINVTGLIPGVGYRFRARAFREPATEGQQRIYTDFAGPTALFYPKPPNAPTNLAVSSVGADMVTLSWKDNSEVERGFDVLARPVGSSTFAIREFQVGNTTVGSTVSGTVERLTPGISYEFAVRARADWTLPAVLSTNSNTVTQMLRGKLTSHRSAQGVVNKPFTFTLTTTPGHAVSSRSISALPPGLTFDSSTGVISGIPTTAGLTQTTVTIVFMDNSTPNATDTFTETATFDLRVLNPPVVSADIPEQDLTTGTAATLSLANYFTDPEATSAVRVDTTLGAMDLVFFENTPLTKANFLTYMNSGAYVNNVFHRSAYDYVAGHYFVIQGGGFKVGSAPAGFTTVTTNPPVQNEPFVPQACGTVAMAKLGGDPNSATCQWFVNLKNNGSILDAQNGGFTAFARVAGNGMDVATAIAAKPTSDYGVFMNGSSSAQFFDDWPLNNTEVAPLMDNTKVLKMNSVFSIPVLSYTVTGNTNPAAATAAIVGGDVVVTPVDSGSTNITITATTLDGNTVSQTFGASVISNVATLASLVPSTGFVSPGFASGTMAYTVPVANSVTSITLTPTSSSPEASITVRPFAANPGDAVPVLSGSASQPLPISVGDNMFVIQVTAENGVVAQDYTVTVRRSAVGLASSLISVNEEAGVVQIPVQRVNDNTAEVTVQISTLAGTATAPSDFVAIANQQVTLGAGVTNVNVPITIVNAAAAEPNETFTVTLSNVGSSTALGAPETATVVIIDSADTLNPAVTIGAPLAGAALSLNTLQSYNLTGTATDNKGVKQVEVSFNGSDWVSATTNPNATATPTTTNWSLSVLPLTGTNTISVKSTDFRNKVSPIVTRSFTVLRPLTINVDLSMGSVTTGYGGLTYRDVGKSFSILATAKPPAGAAAGTLFTGWSISGVDVEKGGIPFTPQRIGITESAKEKNTLTFIFREGLILTANFANNPYLGLVGTYNGLIRPSATEPQRPGTDPDGTVSSNGSEGYFTATAQNTGAFSGKLTIDGFVLNVAGVFDHNGHARFGTARALTQTVARTNKPSLTVALQMDLVTPGINDRITGTVTATDFKRSVVTGVSEIDSDRAFYNGTTQIVPAPYLGLNNANGVFNAILPPKAVGEQTSGFTVQDYPQGHGFGTVTISKAGVVTVALTLADGTGITASSTLSQMGASSPNRFPLFGQAYSLQGFLSGFVQLDSSQAESDLSALNLQWLRPFQGTSQYYPYGWPEVIKVDMKAATYAAVSGRSTLKAPDGADGNDVGDDLQAADADGNAVITFSQGLLTEPLAKGLNVSVTDGVIKVPDNDPTYSLSLTRSTGAFSGIFDHTDDSKPAFKGILYQKGASAGGFGYFLSKLPVPVDYMGESGGVSLIGQP